jgi:hypothetical protein
MPTRPWFRSAPAVAISALLCLPVRAFAGPPFLTDDPEPVELGHWEINIASIGQWTSTDRNGAAPLVDANYGIFEDVQLHAQPAMAYNHPADGDGHYGVGDCELGIKWRFLHEEGVVPQVSLYPLLELPLGNEKLGLGSGRTQAFLPLWIQKSYEHWTSYGGGGYWINPGIGNRNYVYLGWVLQREVSAGLMLGGEIYHATASTVGGSRSTGYNLGGACDIDATLHVLFSGGRTVSGPKAYTSYIGLQLTI